jgi:diguanylate cyclase (GGDEF)-like protein
MADHVHQAIAGGRFSCEYRMIRSDGTVVWIHDQFVAIEDQRRDPGLPLASGSENASTPRIRPQLVYGVMVDITQRKEAEEKLEQQTLYDPTTGLPNRRLLTDRLTQAMRFAQRDGTSMAVLLLDLDRFREINDTFGHASGDRLLLEVGRTLQSCLRESDTVARLGGDEFVVLLTGTDRTGAAYTASKLLKALEKPHELEGQTFDIEATIGITIFPEHGGDGRGELHSSAMLRRAEIAMYACKEANGRYAVYASDQDRYTPDRLALVRELRQAIENNQLVLHYQPKVGIKIGKIDGVEALVRWHHPERGFIQPDQFISLAEHTGLIKPLTIWVLTSALGQCRLWHEAGNDISVAVNLSARNLHDPTLVETVATLLELYKVEPSWLDIEITESALMEDPTSAMENLKALHEMGVKVSIDDFGTGYSSLGYLKRLPVDQIKIDRSFVMEMRTSADDTFIVRTIVDLGDNLGLKVVAEGIENQETLDELEAIGCDFAQGFFMSRPLAADDLSHWLTTSKWATSRES